MERGVSLSLACERKGEEGGGKMKGRSANKGVIPPHLSVFLHIFHLWLFLLTKGSPGNLVFLYAVVTPTR